MSKKKVLSYLKNKAIGRNVLPPGWEKIAKALDRIFYLVRADDSYPSISMYDILSYDPGEETDEYSALENSLVSAIQDDILSYESWDLAKESRPGVIYYDIGQSTQHGFITDVSWGFTFKYKSWYVIIFQGEVNFYRTFDAYRIGLSD